MCQSNCCMSNYSPVDYVMWKLCWPFGKEIFSLQIEEHFEEPAINIANYGMNIQA